MTYNLTFLNGTQVNDIIVGVNDNSGGLYGGGILLCSYLIFYIIFSQSKNTQDAMLANTVINALAAGVMYGIGILQLWILGLTVAIFAGAVIYKQYKD